MNSKRIGCILCGYPIRLLRNTESPDAHSWLPEFRGLCNGPEGVFLSSVGRYLENFGIPSYIAPPLRWDDEGFGPAAAIENNVPEAENRPWSKQRRTYMMHDACYSLLQKFYAPSHVPLQRLYDLCSSLTVTPSVLDWGHNYGGLIRRRPGTRYPWEVPVIKDGFELEVASYSPLAHHEVQELLCGQYNHGDKVEKSHSAVLTVFQCAQDSFSRLPAELIFMISLLLSARDVLNCRLVSRAFWRVLGDQAFWYARLCAERNWFFEAYKPPVHRNWLSLFHRTTDDHISPVLENRRRVWGFLPQLFPLLDLRWDTSSLWKMRDRSEVESFIWRQCVADLKLEAEVAKWLNERKRFVNGARALFPIYMHIPRDIARFVFFYSVLGESRFISGISIVSTTGETVSFGYQSSLSEYHDLEKGSRFTGFVMAMGSRGLHALRVHTNEGDVSEWYGDPKDCPRSMRCVARSQIMAICSELDGCKIVSLFVGELPFAVTEREDLSMRCDAHWFPDIPDPTLDLNESIFPQADLHLETYSPLFWTSFGGPRGIHLSHLTAIIVTIAGGSVLEIDFEYDYHPKDSPKVDKLGRHGYTQQQYCELETLRFPINGIQGERIDRVLVDLVYSIGENDAAFSQRGLLIAFEVFTNFGRSCLFSEPYLKLKAPGDVEQRQMAPEFGKIITGFYASQDDAEGLGITGLGLISEYVDEESW